MKNNLNEKFYEVISRANSIAIAGHIRPDGDCIGSCLALRGYIANSFADTEKRIDVFLESLPECFRFLEGSKSIRHRAEQGEEFDLFIALDCGDFERLGEAGALFSSAGETMVIDHHVTNQGFGDVCIVKADASSTCELLCDLMDEKYIDKSVAQSLYLGIVHDTGVFKHSSTTRHTMETAGMLMDKGAVPSRIIDGTFYEKTYLQNQILGRCLMESFLMMEGRVIVSYVNRKVQDFYGLMPSDTDGIIDELTITKGVEVAILLREENTQEWKVSMRSNYIVDVGRICAVFGGGGHVHAAGCTIRGSVHDAVNSLTPYIDEQLNI